MSERPIELKVAEARLASGLGGRFYGVIPALVTDVSDPNNQGRIKVKLPAFPDSDNGQYEVWARYAAMMGGNNRGSWFIPDVNDEVLVAFMFGDPSHPFVIGGLWNGSDSPPESMDGSGKNNKKVLRSRNGVKLTLDDQDGQEKFIVETPGGQKLTMQDGAGSVEIDDSNGNSISLKSSGVTINASGKVTVSATQVSVSAGIVSVDAGMSKFSGVVQCDTLIATTVVGTTYTPGAGNIW